MLNKYLYLVCCLMLMSCSGWVSKVSKPFAYSGFSAPEFSGFTKSSEYVKMSDGTKIAIDIFIPAEGPPRESFPTVLWYTPYQRAQINPETGEIRDMSHEDGATFLLSHGYALVCADIRGTGISSGWLMDFMPEIWRDGKELIDWMAAQPWCDGNVGMMGGSYVGWSQTATASQKPEALKCIMPAVIPLDGYTGEVYPGGIYLEGFMKDWSGFMYYSERNFYHPDIKAMTAPVTDEDGDGELTDEIPIDVNENGMFLDDGYPPAYRDENGAEREHIYYHATMDHHQGNYDYTEWAEGLFFVDAKNPLGYAAMDVGPNAQAPAIMESGIAVYNVGGWFDGFTRGSFELYCTLGQKNPSRIMITPAYHSITSGPWWHYFGYTDEEALDMVLTEHLRFFDRYLKGIENGIEREDPVLIYVMNGDGWRQEKEWPLKRQVVRSYYFGPEGLLSETSPSRGTDDYTVDYSHSSVYGSNNGNRWMSLSGGQPDAIPVRTELDKKTLLYTSPPMSRDTEVTGHPVVDLWVSSTEAYGDFFIYLEDVDETGQSVLVTEGQLRAGFAGLYDNDDIIPGNSGIEVLPELPWHGYRKDQYVEGILADGRTVELRFDFHPTSWVFRKGHRIQVSIACADAPTFRLHPKLAPNNDPDDGENIVPTVTVHWGGNRPSRIELPIIPSS